jgi:hypothetical protein
MNICAGSTGDSVSRSKAQPRGDDAVLKGMREEWAPLGMNSYCNCRSRKRAEVHRGSWKGRTMPRRDQNRLFGFLRSRV